MYTTGRTASTSWTMYGNGAIISSTNYSKALPHQVVSFMNDTATIYLKLNNSGELYWKSATNSTQSNVGIYALATWALR